LGTRRSTFEFRWGSLAETDDGAGFNATLNASLRRRTNMIKRQVHWVLGLWMVTLALAGCGTATGAAVGAGTGAAVGYGTGYGAGKGALIGTGVGAAAGAIYDIYQYNKK
jgi:hypothetical protein